jgi:hypothetical protein
MQDEVSPTRKMKLQRRFERFILLPSFASFLVCTGILIWTGDIRPMLTSCLVLFFSLVMKAYVTQPAGTNGQPAKSVYYTGDAPLAPPPPPRGKAL